MIKKILILSSCLIFSSYSFAAKHIKLGDFEMVTELPTDIIKKSDCSDYYNYQICKYNTKKENYEFNVDKETKTIVSINKIRNYDTPSYILCQSYHANITDILKNKFNATENKNSDLSSTFNIKYLNYNYTAISKCIDNTSNIVSIYLTDYYKEIIKLKQDEYQKADKTSREQALKDLNME